MLGAGPVTAKLCNLAAPGDASFLHFGGWQIADLVRREWNPLFTSRRPCCPTAIGEGRHFQERERQLSTKCAFCRKSDPLPHLSKIEVEVRFQMAKPHSFAVTGPRGTAVPRRAGDHHGVPRRHREPAQAPYFAASHQLGQPQLGVCHTHPTRAGGWQRSMAPGRARTTERWGGFAARLAAPDGLGGRRHQRGARLVRGFRHCRVGGGR